MNTATQQFLAAIRRDDTLTEDQRKLIDIVTRMNVIVMDEVIDRLVDAQESKATPPPAPAASVARR